VPLYEFRCRSCDETFEVRRPMSQAGEPATCPAGHDDAVRLLSVFASVGASGASGSAGSSSAQAQVPRAGGCGAGCGCMH
jgi:putative FmdB family regulatory protein